MIVLERKPIYDKYTGILVDSVKEFVFVKEICDFCGEDIDKSQEERSYIVRESDSSEPWFSQMFLFYKTTKVDLYRLFKKHKRFVYCCDYNEDWFCEAKMIYEEVLNEQGEVKEGDVRNLLIVNLLYESRLKMLDKMFKEEKYTPENFGLEPE